MFVHLGPTEAARIDRYVNRHCKNPSSYAELSQLHQLFTLRFRRALELLLNRSLQRAGRPAVCDVQLGWIDKIPIARSPLLSKGTELGDAILFAFDERRDLTGKLLTKSARAVILQAKVARSTSQLGTPSVPIGTGVSSKNELALLSSWPSFDLYETARNASACLPSVTVAPSSAPPPEAWFIAAPGRALSASTQPSWPCWWMAGKPHPTAGCTTTIGELLVGLLAPSSSTPVVGTLFTRQTAPAPMGTTARPADWSGLCNEIRRILDRYHAPPSLFGPSQPRLRSIPLWAQLFINLRPSGRRLVMDAAAGGHASCGLCHDPSLYPPVPKLKGKDKRIFVATVTVTRFGED